jgi:hypothetical protein
MPNSHPEEWLMTATSTITSSHQSTRREEAFLLLFASVLVGGVFTDGWAHANIIDELESFFSPFHTGIFVGFVLTSGWLLHMIARRHAPGMPLHAAIPAGYRPALAGVAAFAAGFTGDAVWHTIFGIEAGVDALLSPTHLLMAAAVLTIVSTPYRARPATAGRQTWSADATGVASVLLTALVAGFFLLWAWIPSHDIGSVGYHQTWLGGAPMDAFLVEVSQMAVLASSFVVTAIIVVPVVLLTRTSRPPTGALLAVISTIGIAITAVRELDDPGALVGFVGAGLLAEMLVQLMPASRPRALLIGGMVPTVLWTSYWLSFALAHGLAWNIELYTGQIISAAFIGLGIAALAEPTATSTRGRRTAAAT